MPETEAGRQCGTINNMSASPISGHPTPLPPVCVCCPAPPPPSSPPPQTAYPELPPGLGAFLVQVVRFIILMAQAVPISLYVSLEMVKVLQCKVREGGRQGGVGAVVQGKGVEGGEGGQGMCGCWEGGEEVVQYGWVLGGYVLLGDGQLCCTARSGGCTRGKGRLGCWGRQEGEVGTPPTPPNSCSPLPPVSQPPCCILRNPPHTTSNAHRPPPDIVSCLHLSPPPHPSTQLLFDKDLAMYHFPLNPCTQTPS